MGSLGWGGGVARRGGSLQRGSGELKGHGPACRKPADGRPSGDAARHSDGGGSTGRCVDRVSQASPSATRPTGSVGTMTPERGDPAPPSLGAWVQGQNPEASGRRETALPATTAVSTSPVRVTERGRRFSRRSPTLPDWSRPATPRRPCAARRQMNFMETNGGEQGHGRGRRRGL